MHLETLLATCEISDFQFKFSSMITPKKTVSFTWSIFWLLIKSWIFWFVRFWHGLNTMNLFFFKFNESLLALNHISSMRWRVLVACFQDSNKDGKKYSDQLSDFVVYVMLSFKSTPGFIKTTWFFLSSAERNPLKKQINFCCFKLVSNEETWLALLSWVSENPFYLPC